MSIVPFSYEMPFFAICIYFKLKINRGKAILPTSHKEPIFGRITIRSDKIWANF
jgi:hypothetical protein